MSVLSALLLIWSIFILARTLENPDLASWAGEAKDGLILFSMGSMISEMHESKTQIFVNALNRVPMRVIWRFSGKLPKNVGNNIKVMDWFPQNDLMGHEKTKLFISHGGMIFLENTLVHGNKARPICTEIKSSSKI